VNIEIIRGSDPRYPASLGEYLGDHAPARIFSLGNLDILKQKSLALFCSVKCPGNLILKTYDLARELRNKRIAVISGFHSPMEKECLSLLLRGEQPVVWSLAKRLKIRGVPKECTGPLAEGRLLLLSPFGEKVKRASEKTALFRNDFVAALAERVFVSYATPGRKTEAFCRKVLEWRKQVMTFDSPDNAILFGMGARSYSGPSSITEP
jgi:predicted Rossmann fold nucleotide-binding protein DprA/Smf involved in DNA uptake